MNKEKIKLDRGDKDIVFVQPDMDLEEISERDEPREIIEKKMKEKGLEWENARIIGLFSDEFSLILDDDGKVVLDGEKIYPEP